MTPPRIRITRALDQTQADFVEVTSIEDTEAPALNQADENIDIIQTSSSAPTRSRSISPSQAVPNPYLDRLLMPPPSLPSHIRNSRAPLTPRVHTPPPSSLLLQTPVMRLLGPIIQENNCTPTSFMRFDTSTVYYQLLYHMNTVSKKLLEEDLDCYNLTIRPDGLPEEWFEWLARLWVLKRSGEGQLESPYYWDEKEPRMEEDERRRAHAINQSNGFDMPAGVDEVGSEVLEALREGDVVSQNQSATSDGKACMSLEDIQRLQAFLGHQAVEFEIYEDKEDAA